MHPDAASAGQGCRAQARGAACGARGGHGRRPRGPGRAPAPPHYISRARSGTSTVRVLSRCRSHLRPTTLQQQHQHHGRQVLRRPRLCGSKLRRQRGEARRADPDAGDGEAREGLRRNVHAAVQRARHLQGLAGHAEGTQGRQRQHIGSARHAQQQSASSDGRRERQGEGGAGADPHQPAEDRGGAAQGTPRGGAASQRTQGPVHRRRAEHRAGVTEAGQGGGQERGADQREASSEGEGRLRRLHQAGGGDAEEHPRRRQQAVTVASTTSPSPSPYPTLSHSLNHLSQYLCYFI